MVLFRWSKSTVLKKKSSYIFNSTSSSWQVQHLSAGPQQTQRLRVKSSTFNCFDVGTTFPRHSYLSETLATLLFSPYCLSQFSRITPGQRVLWRDFPTAHNQHQVSLLSVPLHWTVAVVLPVCQLDFLPFPVPWRFQLQFHSNHHVVSFIFSSTAEKSLGSDPIFFSFSKSFTFNSLHSYSLSSFPKSLSIHL